jgi:redox-regulated HSP33 family molecular chaperone
VEEALGTTITRVDLQVSQSRDGEIFITSRQDGIIRMLVADSESSEAPASK